MIETEVRSKLRKKALLCFTKNGFYIIDTVAGVPLEKQAKDNGEANLHIIRIETVFNEVLWTRIKNVPIH